MEEFKNSVKSQTIPLCVLDTQGSFSNIPFVFFYENATLSSNFMSTQALSDSFYKTMEQFPIFAGRIKSKGRGHNSVVVEQTNLNMPDYTESSSGVHIDTLKGNGFSWRAWPDDVATAGPMTKAGEDGDIKLINVHVVRLQDNSGVAIYFSIPHYILDGVAHMEVMKRWCQIYQLLSNGQADRLSEMPAFTVDRSIIQDCLPKDRKPVDALTRQTFTGFSLLAELLAWISPALRGRILSMIVARQKAEAHLFHVSKAAFASLHEAVGKALPDSYAISDNELLLSLITKTLAQSQALASGTSARIKPDSKAELPVAVIFEVREQLGMTSTNYAGNILMPLITSTPLTMLESPTTAESLAAMINNYSETVNSVDSGLVASHVEMVNSRSSCFTRPIVRFARSKTAMSFVYDIMPDMYEADFGSGRPAWVSPIEPFRANAVLLLTSRDTTDGVDVFMTAYPDVMKEVLRNEFWCDFAKLIY
ncbi:hypothetical protein GGI04_004177 [Coemansia thaxteri]|uniref:Uncharacterized protein n=1 Tax=Coemansia thaxteri TaxID=2663907 RepID=A0A9W8EKQ9_9FUNG|nr:hypothetical protein GGI04_004177 [Coemansia thaxteri]KAJ2006789.1 hypothetical protein H4R26_001156 [Coemansia thaxteri]KAJ2467799.1 hypothetical protein GGI02_003908 [Coemansia sp. RSA 2322]